MTPSTGRVAAAVFACALLVFASSAGNGFAHDDAVILLKNPFLHDLGNLGRFFASDYWYPQLVSGLYRPLVTTSFALDVALGGLDPLGFHLVNIALHAACSAIAFVVLRRLTADTALAAAAAFLFATHAVHTEPVANVSAGRPELLAACFVLLSLWAHVSGVPAAGWAAFLAALLCKESAVALPGAVVLADWVYAEPRGPLRLARLGRLLRERFARVYAPYLIVIAAYAGIRLAALGLDQTLPPPRFLDNPLVELGAGWRAVNALQVLLRYAWLLLFPLRLSYDYSYDQIPLVLGFGDPRLAGVALGGAALVALLVLAWRRAPDAFFGLAFALGTLFAVSNVAVPIGSIMAERFLYLPSLGFCVALAAALRALARGRRRAFAAAVVALCVLHGARAIERNGDWKSQHAIWLHDADVSPRSARAQSNAGAVLLEQGRAAEALSRFEAALAIGLPPERFLAPYQGKVTALVELGRFREARALYDVVLRHGPPSPELEARIRAGLREAAASPVP